MKTMKHVFYAGLTLMALASCSQEEIINADMSEAIGFRTSLGKTTRAEIKLNNLGSFNVTAFPTGEANYFTNLKVSSTDAGVTWKTASVHYWPANTLNFTAYAPASISTLKGHRQDGAENHRLPSGADGSKPEGRGGRFQQR